MVQYRNRNEKRIGERFSYPKTIKCKALGIANHAPGEIPVKVKVIDVSSGGMRIQMKERRLAEGSIIQVNMPVTPLNVSVPVLTEVKWISEKRPDVYHIGLQFLLHWATK